MDVPCPVCPMLVCVPAGQGADAFFSRCLEWRPLGAEGGTQVWSRWDGGAERGRQEWDQEVRAGTWAGGEDRPLTTRASHPPRKPELAKAAALERHREDSARVPQNPKAATDGEAKE